MRLAFAVLAAVVASPAEANWTFCVAESGQDIWITDVFAAAHKREWLEADFARSAAHARRRPSGGAMPGAAERQDGRLQRPAHRGRVSPQTRPVAAHVRDAGGRALIVSRPSSRAHSSRACRRARASRRDEIGDRPHQRVGAVGRIAGGAPVEVRCQKAELILKLVEHAGMKHRAALVGRSDRLRAQEFSARRGYAAHRQVRIVLPQHLRHHLAAVVDLRDDAIG